MPKFFPPEIVVVVVVLPPVFAAIFCEVAGLARAVVCPLVLEVAVVTPLEYTLFATVVFCGSLAITAPPCPAVVVTLVVRAVGPHLEVLGGSSVVTLPTRTSHTPPIPSTSCSSSSYSSSTR